MGTSSPSFPGISHRRSHPLSEDELRPTRPSGPSAPPPPRRGRKLGRFALGIAAGLGLGVVFVTSLAAFAIVHLDAPSARRALAAYASDLASRELQGKVDVTDVEHVAITRGWIDVGEITITDPHGTKVLSAYGAHVRFRPIALAKAFLAKTGAVPAIDRVVVDRVNVALVPSSEDGTPTIARAISPKDGGSPPGPPKSASTFRLAITDASVREIGVFGTVAERSIDVRGQVLHASAAVMPDATWLAIPSASFDVAPIFGVVRAPVSVSAAGEVRIPVVSGPRAVTPELRDVRVALASGDVRAFVRGRLEETAVALHVSVPQTTPRAVREILGTSPPIAVPASIEVDVDGTMDRADVVASAKVGEGLLAASGNVDIAALLHGPGPEQPRVGVADAHLVAERLSPRAFSGAAPLLTVGTDAVVHATATTAGLELVVKGRSTGAKENNVAALDLDLRALLGEGRVTAGGHAVASAAGARAEVHFDFDQHGGGGRANAAIIAQVPKIEALRPFVPGLPLRGSVDVVANVGADLGARTFGLSTTIHGRSIAHPSATLPEVALVAHASGTFDEPRFGAVLEAPKVVLSPEEREPEVLNDVRAEIVGTPKLVGIGGHVRTDRDQIVDLATHLAPTKTGMRVAGTRLLVRRGDFRADLAVKELTVDKTTMHVSGFRLASTAGGLRLDGTFDPNKHTFDVDVASTPLDLDALARGLGVDDGSVTGKLLLDVKLATLPSAQRKLVTESEATESSLLHVTEQPPPEKVKSGDAPYLSGRVHVELKDGHVDEIDGASAHVDVGIEDRLVEGTVDVSVKDLARVMLRGAAMVPGRIEQAKSWADAVGRVDIHLPAVDLTRVETYLAKRATTPPPALAGTFTMHGHLERASKDAPPTGTLRAWTRDFAIAKGNDVLQGVDLRLRASLESTPDPNEPMKLDVVADAHDVKGAIAIAHVGTEAPWTKLLEGRSALADLPIVADLVVPPRALHALPPVLTRGLPIDGVLAAEGTVRGTLGAPKVDLRALVDDMIGERGRGHRALLTTTYDGARAKLHLDFAPTSTPDRKQLTMDGELALSAKDLLEGHPTWTARGDVTLDKFPVGMLAGASGIGGLATGKIHADHLNEPSAPSAVVDGRIDFARLRLGDTRFEEAWLALRVDRQAASGELALHGGAAGTVDVKGRVPLAWKNGGAPSVADGGALEATADAKNLRLNVAKSFVEFVDDIDGRLDAHVVAKLTRGTGPDGKPAWNGAPEGYVTIRNGNVLASEIGTRWSDVTGDVRIAGGKVTLKQLTMKSVGGGRASLTGEATLRGLTPRTFHVELDAKKFGIAVAGAKLGDVSGRATADGKMVPGKGRERLDILVTLEKTSMDLASEAGRSVQSLGADPSVVIAQPVEKTVAPSESTGAPFPVTFRFAIPHQAFIRRDDLHVAVSGNPSIAIDGVAKFFGEVVIRANPSSQLQQPSWVEVAGKRFFVQESRVRFEGNEELNPLLDLHVRWEAPDRTIVKVDVTGHLESPKVKFDALDAQGYSAGLTQGEIMSLLVLGRREAGSAQQQQAAQAGAASQSVALVESMTGAILGRQLQKMLPPSVTLNVGPGRYAGGYQHKDVYFEVAYNAGGSMMGPTSIGQTQPRTTFGIEWRFARVWSLMTTVGDTGSALVDLMWNYRY